MTFYTCNILLVFFFHNPIASIGKLEAMKMQTESQLKESLGELSKLKDRLKWLEDERKSIEEKGQSQMTEQSKQLKSLEKSLESLSTEKQALQTNYDKDIESLKLEFENKEKVMEKKWKNKLEEIEGKHAKEIEEHRRLAEESFQKLKIDLEGQLSTEKETSTDKINKLQHELKALKDDFQNKLQNAQVEVNSDILF